MTPSQVGWAGFETIWPIPVWPETKSGMRIWISAGVEMLLNDRNKKPRINERQVERACNFALAVGLNKFAGVFFRILRLNEKAFVVFAGMQMANVF